MVPFLEKIVFPSLISVQDFAYIEEAHGTFEMLKLIECIFRYGLRSTDRDLLENEIQTMTAILELHRLRFGNFHYELKYDKNYKNLEIQRYCLLQPLSEILEQLTDEVGEQKQLSLSINYQETDHCVRLEKRTSL